LDSQGLIALGYSSHAPPARPPLTAARNRVMSEALQRRGSSERRRN
jgi:hypothetical protein